jgi:hypothetical protein
MKKEKIVLALIPIIVLVLWFVYLFFKERFVLSVLLGAGIGWTTARLAIKELF